MYEDCPSVLEKKVLEESLLSSWLSANNRGKGEPWGGGEVCHRTIRGGEKTLSLPSWRKRGGWGGRGGEPGETHEGLAVAERRRKQMGGNKKGLGKWEDSFSSLTGNGGRSPFCGKRGGGEKKKGMRGGKKPGKKRAMFIGHRSIQLGKKRFLPTSLQRREWRGKPL